MRGMSVGTVVNQSVVREARASAQEPTPPITTTEQPVAVASINTDDIWLEDYSEKSFAVRGSTLPFKDQLNELGGKFIPLKTGGKGWNFSKKKLGVVAKLLKIQPTYREV